MSDRQAVCCDRCVRSDFVHAGMCRCGCHDGTLPYPIWGGSSVALDKREYALKAGEHPREIMDRIVQRREQGDNTERLPNDAYAAQGGKAAVNELLAMKMHQVLVYRNRLDEIRDETDLLYTQLFNYTQEMKEGIAKTQREGVVRKLEYFTEKLSSIVGIVNHQD